MLEPLLPAPFGTMPPTQPLSSLSPLKKVVGILALAIAYAAMAELSRYVASTPQDVTPVWPPDGIGVASVLLFGNWMGYGVFLGSFLANFWAFQDPSSPLALLLSTLPVFGIAIGTTLGTLLGVALLRRFTQGVYPLDHVSGVFKFLVLAGLFGPVFNASIGVLCLSLSGNLPWEAYQSVWLTWWISNVSGIFILTPVLLSWGQHFYKVFPLREKSNFSLGNQLPSSASTRFPIERSTQLYPPKRRRTELILEVLILLSIVLVVAQIAFNQGYHLEYMLIPMLLWSSFRLGQGGATTLTFIVAAIAVIATVNGKGSFITGNLNESLIQLQSFIGVITLTILLLTATIAERAQSENRLRLAFAELARSNETLETRVQQRTEELHEKNITLKETLETLKRTQLQMLQSEKMSALGQMVAGIAHEINNPVNFIHGNLGHLDRYTQDLLQVIQEYQTTYPNPPQPLQDLLLDTEVEFVREDLLKLLRSMQVGSERIREIVLSLRNFSRLGESELKAADLHEGLDNTLLILHHRLREKSEFPALEIVKHYGSLPLVECYPAQLNQVFMNLLANAIDALQEAAAQRRSQQDPDRPGIISISTQVLDQEWVKIAIADNGPGIPEDTRSRIFDPFFTTKPVNKGTGLGLSISYQIVTEQHQGKLWCDSKPGEGTTFWLEVPIQQSNG